MEKLKNLKIYIATGNKSKLANFQLIFSWIDPKIVVQQVPNYVEVEESGKTVAKNSKLKVLPYKNKYSYPVISNDSGLFFDSKVKEIQDPVQIKRNALAGKNEHELSQKEMSKCMFYYYKNLARKYGGSIDCQMKDVFTLLTPQGKIYQEKTTRNYQLVDRNIKSYDLYHPLNNLRISKATGKFIDEMNEVEDKEDKKELVDALKQLIREI